ncbi:MAG: calcium-binding protein, partial [Ardenticatenaceae bacterium]
TGVGTGCGDLNADGFTDLAVGARQADPGGRENAGETYVLFGPLAPGTLELATDADLTLNGVDEYDLSGYGLDGGDLNQDGTMDLVVGAWAADSGGQLDAGEAYILFGPLAAGTAELATAADAIVHGVDPLDHMGIDARIRDVNQDDVADLLLGATTADPGGRVDAGEAYIVYGPLTAGTVALADIVDVIVAGINQQDYFGIGLAAGDITADGIIDLIFGAFRADPEGRPNAGETYVMIGGTTCAGREATLIGTAGDDVLTGTAGDDVIVALAGNDTVAGLDGNDWLCGGPGNDRYSGGAGTDRIIGEAGRDIADCGPDDDYMDGGAGIDVAMATCESTINVEVTP